MATQCVQQQKRLYRKNNIKMIKQTKAKYYKNNKATIDNDTAKYYQEYKEYSQKCFEYSYSRYRNIEILEHIDRVKLKYMYDGKRVYCGQELKDKFHTDHLLPVSRYEKIGKKCPHDYNNVVPACPTCNLEKHDKTSLEFMWGGVK
jgi:5-methylcytosine-specific restriction endonuclease McrA